MKRPISVGSLSLAVSVLAISMGAAPASAADPSRPTPHRATAKEAVRDAEQSVAEHPRAVRASARDTFRSRAVEVDADGTRHVHLDRSYRGLPVLGGDVVVHSDADGDLRQASQTLKKPLSLATRPVVSERQAERTARKSFGNRRGTKVTTSAALVVDALSGTPRLAWRVRVDGTAPDQSPSHLNVLVDAESPARAGTVSRP
ncbi:hypothetical protein [Streptomyces bauhiniae]|uniref:hypothetical protein n=1 Tax=Streptomyces bauhiniae TaxID=2340725 RepID=UPI00365A54B9